MAQPTKPFNAFPGPRAFRFGRTAEPITARFWRYVEKTDTCWLWTGYRNNKGYGLITIGSTAAGTRRMVLAHRLAYELQVGPIPEGALICHHCDVRACVYPEHLYAGSEHENHLDMYGRSQRTTTVRGAKHGRSVLDQERAHEIILRYRFRANGGLAALAQEFGVCTDTIRRVLHGRHWSVRQ